MSQLEDEYVCQKCGELYELGSGCEPTTFCNLCAQEIISALETITPQPPNAITWENGVEILNQLQKELYSNHPTKRPNE